MWVCFWLLVNTYACVCVSTFGGHRLASVWVSYWTWELTSLMRMIDGWSFQDLPMSLSLPPPRTGAGDWWRTCESSFYRGSHFIDSSIDPAPQRGSGAWVFLFASFFILLSWDTDDSVVSPVHVFKKWGHKDDKSCTFPVADETLTDIVRPKHLSLLTSHFCICSCRRKKK